MRITTTKQYYTYIRNNQPTTKKLVDIMTKQLEILRMIDNKDISDEAKERARQQANNIIEACQMITEKYIGYKYI